MLRHFETTENADVANETCLDNKLGELNVGLAYSEQIF